jgi:hypothetical protein
MKKEVVSIAGSLAEASIIPNHGKFKITHL